MRLQMGAQSGYPDIIVCYNGFFIGIELKREDGKGAPTEQQLKMRMDIESSGGKSVIISSMEELDEVLSSCEDLLIIPLNDDEQTNNRA